MKSHSGSKIADKFQIAAMIDQNDVTKHLKMMFFDCRNACQFHRWILILTGYCLAAIKDLL